MMKQIEKIAEWLGSGSINIFGMPFAGKDTQGELLATALDAVRLSGGEILRNSVIPPHVQEAIDAGNLAPTDEYIDIVLPYLSKQEFAGKPLILSSVGRWKGEEGGVIAACGKRPVSEDLKESVAEEVEADVRQAYDREVPSVEIGRRVAACLRDIDEIAYIRYASEYYDFRSIDELANEVSRVQSRTKQARGQAEFFEK